MNGDAVHIDEKFHYVIAHVLAYLDCEDNSTLPQLTAGDDASNATWVRVADGETLLPYASYPTLSSINAGQQAACVKNSPKY